MASRRAPRLIDFSWGDPVHPKVTLVGKGVCFDTGGLDLKPSSGMLLMKKDMGGAANVLALAQMVMDAQLKLRLRVLIPAVENAVAGNAFRPLDIFKSRKGLTVEIGNTDAEGRLILADALALADEEKPDLLVDLGTLTGAARVALGPDLPPFYTNDEALAQDVAACAKQEDDSLWRLTPARPDLAAKYLEGKIAAARFVNGEEFEIAESLAPLREAPSSDATLLTQALKGERVTIYDRNGEGFAWGQLNSDGYVGWLPDRTLAKPIGKPTHKITALRTFAFPGPSIKLPPVDTLVMGAIIAVIREDGAFAVTRDGWHLPLPHVGRIDRHADDFVGVAEQFAGTPYLCGGKSRLGIDCSGLVQVSLNAAGTGCPRDSDMQQDSLGRALDASESKRLQRGDRICWERHVPLVANRATIAPAN